MIQLENVHKSYGQTKVLKGIDLQIQDQDDVVVLGPSGSGKSTLLKRVIRIRKSRRGAYPHSRAGFIATHGCSIDSL